jgi:hypothetical protein
MAHRSSGGIRFGASLLLPAHCIDPDTFETSRLTGVVGDQMAADAQNSGDPKPAKLLTCSSLWF